MGREKGSQSGGDERGAAGGDGELELYEIEVEGEVFMVASFPLVPPGSLDGLTEAERDIVSKMVLGIGNREIARRRGTSERTVAVQIQSIFRKLDVGSRAELIQRLQEGAREPTGEDEGS